MIPIPRPFSRRHARRSRPASAYLLVIMTTFIVAVIGLSAIAMSRIEMRRSASAADFLAARAAARAAVELGFLKIRNETTWSNLGSSSAAWATSIPFQGGTYALTRTAYDNTDPLNDRLTLLATGTHGDTVYKLQVVIVHGTIVDTAGVTQVVN